MVTSVDTRPRTALEIAEAELKEETSKRAVVALKEKLKAIAKAEAILANLRYEVADLNKQIEEGTF